MRRSLWKAAAGLVALAAAAGPVVLAAPAHAASTDVLAIAGSDTTQDVMAAVFGCGANSLCTSSPIANPTYNLYFDTNQTTQASVPADPNCNNGSNDPILYKSSLLGGVGAGSWAPGTAIAGPAGSGAGRTALVNSVAKTYPNAAANTSDAGTFGGCIDIARSSGFATGNSHMQFYAFALDAVGITSPSLNAPASLTLAEVRGIFNCTFNDWSQVGGRAGPIQRVVPQAGSGTGDFFIQVVLGDATTARTITNFPESGGNGPCPTPFYTEENAGKVALDPAIRNVYQNVIMAYSAGKWVYQANGSVNPTIDIRAGERPIAIVNNDSSTGITGAAPATPMRWKGSTWTLNDATVLLDGKYNARTTAAVSLSNSGASITGPGGTFTQNDVGKTVTNGTSTQIQANTTITAVDGPGAVATISPAPGADEAAVTVKLFDKNRAVTVSASGGGVQTLTGPSGTFRPRDIGLTVQGSFLTDGTVIDGFTSDTSVHISLPTKPAQGSYTSQPAVLGWSLVSDKNPNVLATSDIQYTGARYVYNVLNDQSPNYLEARSLVGFNDTTAAGALSSLCNGGYEGVINANGFQALPALDRDGAGVGNDLARTCVLRIGT